MTNIILNYQYLRLTLWHIQEKLIENEIEKAKKELEKLRLELHEEERKNIIGELLVKGGH